MGGFPYLDQGVVTYMSPAAIKFFDQQKVCLIALSSEALDHLIFEGQKSRCSHEFLIVEF